MFGALTQAGIDTEEKSTRCQEISLGSSAWRLPCSADSWLRLWVDHPPGPFLNLYGLARRGDRVGSEGGGGLLSPSLGLRAPALSLLWFMTGGDEQAKKVLRKKLKTFVPSVFLLLHHPAGWKPCSLSPLPPW